MPEPSNLNDGSIWSTRVGECMGISRRSFLKGGIGLCASLSMSELWALGAQANKPFSACKTIVIVQLLGGNDGLNTVVPYASDAYYSARPTIGIKPEDVLRLDANVGLHNGMPELAELFKRGKLAVIQGVGYPEPSRSHYRSLEIWHTAEPRRIEDTGWLGRYLDLAAPSTATASEMFFPAINVDPVFSKSLSAQRVFVPSVSAAATDSGIASLNAIGMKSGDASLNAINVNNGVSSLNAISMNSASASLIGVDADDGVQCRDAGSDRAASDYLNRRVRGRKFNSNYPDDSFGQGLQFIAQMIATGVDCKIYNITLSGFDTHTNGERNHDQLMRKLSSGLNAFQQDLEAHGKDESVVVMAFSEFGRRLAENGGCGTDHGSAAPVLVLGSSINGGVIGEAPSLTNLRDGDLVHTTDFRSVYATILDKWFGADSREILGCEYEQLRLFRNS